MTKNNMYILKKMAKLAKKDETVFQSLAESMRDGQIDFSFPNASGLVLWHVFLCHSHSYMEMYFKCLKLFHYQIYQRIVFI